MKNLAFFFLRIYFHHALSDKKTNINTLIMDTETDAPFSNDDKSDSKDVVASVDKKSFGRDLGKLVSGTVIAQIIAVCLTPIITRIFSPEIYGIFSVFVSLVSIITVVVCLRYELAIMLPKDEKDAGAIFILCLIVLMCISVICIPIMFFFGDTIATMLGCPDLKSYLFLIPIAVFVDGLYIALRYWNTRRKRFGTQATTQALQSVSLNGVQLGLGLSGFISPGSLIIGKISGNALGTLILAYQAVRTDLRLLRDSFSIKRIWKQFIRYKKFPLLDTWGAWLNTLSGALPIFIFSIYFTSTEVGYYTLGYQILFIPMTLIGASIAQVFFQRASIANHDGTLGDLVTTVTSSLASISIVPFSIFAVCGGELFSVVFGGEWYAAGVYAQILTLWIFLVFITSPISSLTSVLEIQGFGLKMNLITVVLRFAALVVGGVFGNIYLSLVLFMLSGVILVGYSNYYYMKSSKGKIRDVLSHVKKYLIVSVILMCIFSAMVLCYVPNWIILISAGVCLVVYEIMLITKDKSVKKLLSMS